MPAPSSPTWLHATMRRRSGYGDLRVSDAERAEVADLLSKHYGDGRLDQAEFEQRLDRAMKAKTYSDLGGLFADLPRTEAEASQEPKMASSRRLDHRRPRAMLGLVVLVIAAATVAGHALIWSFNAWVWLALLGAVLYATLARRGPS